MPHSTLLDILDGIVARRRSDLLRYKEGGSYHSLSAEDLVTRVRQLAAFLVGCGIQAGERVALLSENRMEWTISDFAIQLAGAVNVPIYTTLSREQVQYLLRDSACRLAFVSQPELLKKVLEAAAGAPALSRAVLFDPPLPGGDARWRRSLVGKDAGIAGNNVGIVAKDVDRDEPPCPPASAGGEQSQPVRSPSVGSSRLGFTVVAEPDLAGLARGVSSGSLEGTVTKARLEVRGDGVEPFLLEVGLLEEAYREGERWLRADPVPLGDRRRLVGPEELTSIIYTSGTTGEPKGVMLTHRNFCSNIDACLGLIPFSESDVALSFLPLSHVFERTVEYIYLAAGGSIAYAESIEKVAANMLEIRPTVVSAVPRVLEKIQRRVLERAESSSRLERWIFEWAMATGRRRLARALASERVPLGERARLWIADRLVFSKIKAALGGRVRFIVSGGAPLPPEVAEFFLAAGIVVLEGYGLTETSPVVAVNTLDHLRPGTVGRPIPGVEVRIAADGEILVRGSNVMKGYFGKPEATAEVVCDGWFATGDIGRLDPDGFLVITDRKKDLLITSGGKNVAPQPIENAIKASPYIAGAVLVGDRRNFIAALVVPDFESLGRVAAARGWGELTPAQMTAKPEVRELIDAEICKVNALLAPFERVKKFALLDCDFTIEAGEITPTLKVRRRVVVEHYGSVIEALYER